MKHVSTRISTRIPYSEFFHLLVAWLVFAPNAASAADQPTVANPQPIRLGIITEKNGPHLDIYLKSVAVSEGVAQVAIADESGAEFERAKRVLTKYDGEVATFRGAAKMVSEFKPHLALVALPAHTSPTAIRVALEGGCHVLSEKPGCVKAEQFAELVELARAKKRDLMLSLPSRVSARTLRAREIVKNGWLGKLYSVNVLQVKDQARLTSPSYQKSWYASREKSGGGHLIWLGIHNMDQIHFITGDRVEKVSAFCNNVGGQPIKIEDAEAVSLKFKSGIVGTFQGGYFLEGGKMESGFTLWGSHGWIRLNAYRRPDGSGQSFQWYSTHEEAPRGVQTENPSSKSGGYEGFVQAAVDAARGLREAPLSAEDSLAVLQVIFAAYKSSETGRAQTLLPANESGSP